MTPGHLHDTNIVGRIHPLLQSTRDDCQPSQQTADDHIIEGGGGGLLNIA